MSRTTATRSGRKSRTPGSSSSRPYHARTCIYDNLFKPAKDQRKDDETLDDTLERIRASLAARNKLPPGWSKIVDVDIAINRDPRRVEKPSADTKQAEEDLAFLLSTGRLPANPDWLKNPALRRSSGAVSSNCGASSHTRGRPSVHVLALFGVDG